MTQIWFLLIFSLHSSKSWMLLSSFLPSCPNRLIDRGCAHQSTHPSTGFARVRGICPFAIKLRVCARAHLRGQAGSLLRGSQPASATRARPLVTSARMEVEGYVPSGLEPMSWLENKDKTQVDPVQPSFSTALPLVHSGWSLKKICHCYRPVGGLRVIFFVDKLCQNLQLFCEFRFCIHTSFYDGGQTEEKRCPSAHEPWHFP